MKPLVYLFVLWILFACSQDIEPGSRPGEHPVVSGLTLERVTEGPVAGAESYVGTVESRDRGTLAARTDGRVERIAVREGARVNAGELLMTIADNQAGDRFRQAEATVSAARKRLASVRARASLAEKTFERYDQLFRNEAVTPQEMDRVGAELEEARQQVAVAQAELAGAESARGAARTALDFTRVIAPYDAVVVRWEVEEGSTVQPAMPLLVLDRPAGWQVRAEIPEARAGRIVVGDRVEVEIPSLGKILPARIAEVQPAADPRSHTFRVKVELPVESEVSGGLFSRVIIPGGGLPTVLVPASAVVERGQLSGVYLVKEGILHYRLVKTGRRVDGRLEILSGLDPGDTVVVQGVEKARSGARVEG